MIWFVRGWHRTPFDQTEALIQLPLETDELTRQISCEPARLFELTQQSPRQIPQVLRAALVPPDATIKRPRVARSSHLISSSVPYRHFAKLSRS